MRTLDKLLQVSDMTSQPAAYLIINRKKPTISSKIDLSKQKILDADPKQTEQTTFPGNLDQAEETKMFFNVKKVKETIVNFLQVSVKVNLCYRFIQTVI